MDRALPIEEDGINASTGCCFKVSEAESQFLDAEATETGSVHIMQFLRAGITRAADGALKSASGAALTGKKKKTATQSFEATMLDQVCSLAGKLGVPLAVQKMADIGEEDLTMIKYGRPPGYQARTRLFFGNLQVPVMLDACASCSVIQEEIAASIILHAI